MVELDFPTLAAAAAIIVVLVSATFAMGRLFEKVKNLEKKVDKLDTDKQDKKSK